MSFKLSLIITKHSMLENKDIYKELCKPFEEADLEWRCGATNAEKTKCLALVYVTNRAIMKRLDEVVGFNNWYPSYREHHKGVICALSLRIDGEWITKEDGADETDIESTKGGLSDSMKRAAVQWGIGRYLYDAETVWAAATLRGKSVVITERPVLKIKANKQPQITVEEACHLLTVCQSLEVLQQVFINLPKNIKADIEVIAKKDEMKNKLS